MECGKKLAQRQAVAERRQISIMFCDLVGSTALSETMDAEELRELIRIYQTSCEAAVQKHEGYIAQYLGDGLMVYFGYPRAHEDDAQRAIRGGLGILQNLTRLNQQLAIQQRPEIAVRIGIHTGSVVVGEVGGNLRTENLAIGDTPNIAARIQGVAEANTIAISQDTYALARGLFTCQSLGKKKLKGISKPIEVFQVEGESGMQHRLDALGQHELSPLVGRDLEYQLLMERWATAQKGKGTGVLLMGEAGIGKSRLVHTLKAKVQQEQDAVLRECRCSTYAQNSAFLPLIDMLRQVLSAKDSSSEKPKIAQLKRLLADGGLFMDPYLSIFADLLSIPLDAGDPQPQLAPAARKQKTMEGFLQLVRADKSPVLLVFEDLHWADASSVEWLQFLLHRLGEQPIFVLMTARPSFTNEDFLAMTPEIIELERLSREAILDICSNKSQGKALPRVILEQVVAKTDGIPLFVEELTQTILESGQLIEKENSYEMESGLDTLSIPSTIQASLTARLDRLTSAKDVAQVGAVIGREFSVALLKAVSKLDDLPLNMALQQLSDAELIFPKDTTDKPTYVFKHALVQDTAYDTLLKSRKYQVHQLVAMELEEMYPEIAESQPELLAHHYSIAQLKKKAFPLWEKAGNQALQRNANLEAVQHFQKGLATIDAIEYKNQRENAELRMLNSLGAAIMMTKTYSDGEAKQVFNRSWELCQKVDDSLERIKTLMGLFAGNFIGGNHPAAFGIAERALQMALNEEDDLFMVMSNNAIGISYLLRGNYEKAHFHCSEVLRLYNPHQHDAYSYLSWGHFNVNAGAYLIWNLTIMGFVEQARKMSKKLFTLIESRENHISYFHVYYWTAIHHSIIREWDAGEKLIAAYLAIAKKYGDPFYIGQATLISQLIEAYQGDTQALLMSEQFIDQLEKLGIKGILGPCKCYVADCYLQRRRFEDAIRIGEQTLELTAQTGEIWFDAEVLRIIGDGILGRTDNQSEAEKYFMKALDLAREQKAKLWELRASKSLARLWQQQGKHQQALELLSPVYQWFQEGFDTQDLREAKMLLKSLS